MSPLLPPLDPLDLPLEGAHLVEASAGTGKTWTISTLVVRLLLEWPGALDVDQLLVLTFTRAAAAELRSRIRSRIQSGLTLVEQRLRGEELPPGDPVLAALIARQPEPGTARQALALALQDFDRASICTLHAFCGRALGDQALEHLPPEGALVEDAEPLWRELVEDFQARNLHDAPPAALGWMLSRRLSTESLVRLVGKVARDPDLRVLPEPGHASSIEEPARRFDQAWKLARRSWAAAEPAVRQLLEGAAGLHGGRWTPDLIQARLQAVERLLSPPAEPPSTEESKLLVALLPDALARSTKKGHTPPEHPFFIELEQLLEASSALDAACTGWWRELQLRLVEEARIELPRRKAARGIIGYDDLLHRLDRALQAPGGGDLARHLRKRHPVVLVDEFQDTDPIQHRILQAIYDGSPGTGFFAVGDPKQAIYAFRGADLNAYLAAGQERGVLGWSLHTGWRSDPGLVRALNTLLGRARLPFLREAIPYRPVAPRPETLSRLLDRGGRPLAPLSLAFLEREGLTGERGSRIAAGAERVPELVARQVAALLNSGARLGGRALEPADLAVLVRTNQQARQVRAALQAIGVPAVLQSDESVLRSEEAAQLERLLRAVAEPGDGGRVRAALTSPLLGLDTANLHALLDDEALFEGWLERLCGWGLLWEERGFATAFEALLQELGLPARLLTQPDGERRLTDLLHLGELLQDVAWSQHLSPQGLVRWLSAARRQEGNLPGGEPARLRLERDTDAVRVSTVHRAKGLEYPVVFCPYLWEPVRLRGNGEVLFPDPERGHRRSLDLGSPQQARHRALAEEEELAEALRITYVALTRARHRCIVTWGAFSGMERSALAFLLHADGADPAAAIERCRKLDDEGLLEDLSALTEASEGSIAVERLAPLLQAPVPPPWKPPGADDLRLRPLRRSLAEHPWRTASFSRLVQAGGHHRAPPLAPNEPRPDAARIPLWEFPGGSRPGSLLHDVLEGMDLSETRPEPWRRQVRKWLRRYGEPEGRWTELLVQALLGVLQVPLDPDPQAPSLARIPASQQVHELEFVLPVGRRNGKAGTRLSPARLAEVLERHGEGLPPGYTRSVAALSFGEVEGWLRGFIDLVYCWQGRWTLVDYKSNFLGPSVEDYQSSALEAAMAGHHYLLQVHLYAVALHRHLQRRLKGYDPERHLGGARYLFLRGMAAEHGPGHGVWQGRVPARLVLALDRLIAGEPAL